MTLDGKRVLPTDEFGNPVIPRDREGKPLIHFSADGVTPLSNAEYKVWKQFQKQYKNYPAQHHAVKSREAFDSVSKFYTKLFDKTYLKLTAYVLKLYF